MQSINDFYELNNGVRIPRLGFGTWQTPDGETAVKAVQAALASGYRHIDTAAVYGNERSIGEAIHSSGVKREEIFITSKLWNSERGYERTLAAFQTTMRDLRLDYLDLYLIHWPAARGAEAEWQRVNNETWRAFEKLYREKRIRAIGLSNFLPHHMKPLLAQAEVKPAVDQIEFHPGYMQQETVAFCRRENILVEAWGPLGTGRVLNNPELQGLAEKYGKSVAQLCIRWCLQHETLPLPKSVHPERIEQNARVFDFEIAEEDMEAIDEMPTFGFSGIHPDEVTF